MNYFDFISELRKNKVYLFTISHIKNLFPDEKPKTLKNNLVNWVLRGRLIKLKRDLYEFTEPGIDSKIPDLYAANRLYGPSYISFLCRKIFKRKQLNFRVDKYPCGYKKDIFLFLNQL